jgi:hypothetical protein
VTPRGGTTRADAGRQARRIVHARSPCTALCAVLRALFGAFRRVIVGDMTLDAPTRAKLGHGIVNVHALSGVKRR